MTRTMMIGLSAFALDENTRIDRPAHVGETIRALLDDRGRAVVIRNTDKDE